MIAGGNHTMIHGGPLAVGEVITSSVKNRLRMPVFATFPKGEGLAAAPRSSNKLPDKRGLAGIYADIFHEVWRFSTFFCPVSIDFPGKYAMITVTFPIGTGGFDYENHSLGHCRPR